MGIFKRLFKREKAEEVVVEESKEALEEVEPVSTGIVCAACELNIHGEQKSVKVAGKRYHVKPCWRTIQKMGKQQAFG